MMRRPDEPADPRRGTAAERWARIRALTEAVLPLGHDARGAYLDRACEGDATLRAEVDAQVLGCELAERSPSFLDSAAAEFAAPLLSLVNRTGGIVDDRESSGETESSAQRAVERASFRAALAGRYDIEHELGRGGMATVYLARDRRHDRSVALKVLDSSLRASMSAERFLREIRLTASLTHPHILPLHDSGEAAGQLYYVMPHAEGETLRARIARDGALPMHDCIRLLREIADALSHAHRSGIVHRDLKPENILLVGGHAIVADFGVARAVGSARGTRTDIAPEGAGAITRAGVSFGTPAYMAPEQATYGVVDHRADLYALGVIAYEVFLGEHPFGAATPQAMIAAHIAQAPPSPADGRSDLDPAIAALMMRLLAKDPAHRPPDANAVVETLDAIGTRAPARLAGRTIMRIAAFLVVGLAVAGYAVRQRPSAEAGAPGAHTAIRSVAVLPFDNIGGTADDEYFSDGLTDELAHALTQLPGLQIAGRMATYAFKDSNVPATEIGRTLGVDAYVSATIRRSGERLRVGIQLVGTADGTIIWSSVFESSSGDLFAVQDSLTRAVIAALAPSLGGSVAGVGPGTAAVPVVRGTRDAEAYELFLLGAYHLHERGIANIQRAIALFQQAIGRDPTFARAYANLAFAYSILGVYAPHLADSTGPLMKTSARNALTLDSTLADAHLATAMYLVRDSRFADAEAHHRAALDIEPSHQMAHHSYGGMLTAMGRTEEAITELRIATRLDPLAKSAGTMLAEAFIDARDYEQAETEARRVLAIDPTFALALFSLGLAQALGGSPDDAVQTLERATTLHPTFYPVHARLLFAYAAAGRWQDIERMRTEFQARGADAAGGALAAFADFLLGSPEPLLELVSSRAGLQSWFDMLRPTFTAPGCNPLNDPLLSDPGYRHAVRDLAIAECPAAGPWPLPPGLRGAAVSGHSPLPAP